MPGPLALPVLPPTALVVPERFSYSSLQQLRECPRRWQLRHARYGDQTGYPEAFSPPAERGRMVHELVSQLFRAMAAAGNPTQGSAAFQAAARELKPLDQAAFLVDEARRKLAAHPRGRGQRLSFTPLEIYSAASLLFQREYRPATTPRREPRIATRPADPATRQEEPPAQEALAWRLRRQGVLSEKPLMHPTLPLHGIVDLLLWGQHGAIVVDFKTGAPHASHHEQVQLYGLLWWRQEGHLPEGGEVRYGARAEEIAMDEATLLRLEQQLTAEISQFRTSLVSEAPALVGDHCHFCPVRPLCDRYWEEPLAASDWVDAEILIEGDDALGLRGTLLTGQAVRVLLSPPMDGLRAELPAGTRTRWLGLRRDDPAGPLERTAQTEVFSLPKVEAPE
jgi:hypothetical protein